ncbi:SAXO2 protein, partial [Amia calva]|nr:SAXO2 protein [Amia calva]
FRADYVRHEMPQKPTKTFKEYIQPEGVMRLDTTYSQEYKSYPNHHQAPKLKPAEYRPSSAKMDVIPTYKDDYRSWGIPKREIFRTESNLKLSGGKFSNSTTVHDDYGAKVPTEMRESYKPAKEVKESLPFNDLTNYKVEYISHNVQPRLRRERKPYRPQAAPFDALTTHKNDYKGLQGVLTKPIKSKDTWHINPSPFEASTEFRDKYKPWPIQPPHVRKPAEYKTPEGTMDTTSMTHAHFTGHSVQPSAVTHTHVKAWKKGKLLHNQSTMKEDYKPWEAKKRSPIVQLEQMEKSVGPFESTTTFRSHYMPHTLCRSLKYKPAQTTMPPLTMENDTTCRTTEKEIKVCPASLPVPPGSECEATASHGPKLYRSTSGNNHMSGSAIKTTSKPNTTRKPAAGKNPARHKEIRNAA